MRIRGKSVLTTIIMGAFLAAPALAQDRDTGWELGFDVNYLLGDDVDFEGGSVADVNDDWGFAVSFGYRFNPKLELQTTIDWSDVDYDANLVRADLPGSLGVSGTMEAFTLMAKGVYNFMDGPVTPFISAGLGWSWIDTNIPTGSVQVGCWWDPWWGQICAPYQNTKSVDGFRYSGGLGLRWDLTSSMSFRGSWEMHWLDLSHANGTPSFQQIKVGLTRHHRREPPCWVSSAHAGFRRVSHRGSRIVFTGLVQEVGRIRAATDQGGDQRFEVEFGSLPVERLQPGASISVDGVCLTVARLGADSFFADVSGETLRVTTLGAKQAGARVNLEPALRAGDALGGHWVSGHVDGIAEVTSAGRDARSLRVELTAPRELARFIARKGSVTLDGVSLTVNDVNGSNFNINLIPHTLEVTTLGQLAPGAKLNLEIDLLARYAERLSTAS